MHQPVQWLEFLYGWLCVRGAASYGIIRACVRVVWPRLLQGLMQMKLFRAPIVVVVAMACVVYARSTACIHMQSDLA